MKNIFIHQDSTILSALEKLQLTGSKCLIVIKKNKTLLGTLNDGDIRRGLLNKKNINSTIKDIFKKKCLKVSEKNISKKNILNKTNKFPLIPVVDKDNKVIDILFSKKKIIKFSELKNTEVVIMAGGIGTRLRPYTNILPKPLIPYKDKTIIEHVIDFFTKFKINKFIISINYKNYLISSFFKELKPNYKYSFLYERSPLGTAGVLNKLKNKKNKTFIVTNCDTLVKVDLAAIVNFHKKNLNNITIISSSKEFKIPYGVCQIKNNRLYNILEKPKNDLLVNTGFYVVSSNVFSLIKKNQNLSFVDFIKICLKNNKKVGVYPIASKDWQDFGQSIKFDD